MMCTRYPVLDCSPIPSWYENLLRKFIKTFCHLSGSQNRDIFAIVEAGFIRRNLIGVDLVRAILSELARRFENQDGDRFQVA